MNWKSLRYEVQVGSDWVVCSKAHELGNGWLEYELADGTTGLTKTWRKTTRKK